MIEVRSKNNTKMIWLIVLFYCFYTQFFSSSLLIKVGAYSDFMIIIDLLICTLLVPYAFKSHSDTISKKVWLLCLLFVFALFWGHLYWNESIHYGLKNLFKVQGAFTLFFYFFYKKYNVSYNAMVKSIFYIAIIYSFCYVLGLLTYPNQLFGASFWVDNEVFESSMENRGVLRLFVQGSDFIVIAIFFVLLRYRHYKRYYLLLLIPLFIMLVLRGTRTPLMVTFLMCLLYYLKNIKNKAILILILITAFFSFSAVNEALLNSQSDNPIVKYVQLTHNQVQNDGEDDIRIQMSEYMLTKFNSPNPICTFMGNGIPGNGNYHAKLKKLEIDNAFWIVDVGFITIFVYFGIIGLVMYAGLLIAIIRIRVDKKYLFAKFYLYYLYLILPTNCSLILMSSFMVAMTLYLLYLGNKEYRISKLNSIC